MIKQLKTVAALGFMSVAVVACGGGGGGGGGQAPFVPDANYESGTFRHMDNMVSIDCVDFYCTVQYGGNTYSGSYSIDGNELHMEFTGAGFVRINTETGTYEYGTRYDGVLDGYHNNVTSVTAKNSGTAGTADTSTDTSNVNYSGLNVSGLREAHDAGWTGDDVVIVVHDGDFTDGHGRTVSDIAGGVAPGATIVELDNNGNSYANSNVDVVNHSYGVHRNYRDGSAYGYIYVNPRDHDELYGWDVRNNRRYTENHVDEVARSWVEGYEARLRSASNAVHVYSAGNNGNVYAHGHLLPDDFDATARGSLGYTRYGYTLTIPGTLSGTMIDNTGCTTATHGSVTRFTADSCTDIKWTYDAGADVSRTIWVGAVDDNGELTGYSVAAGSRAMYDFIVADGRDPAGTNGEGTSYAAPRVTGAAALVIHKFGTDAVNTKSILLNTADDLGAPGVDAVYGHGRLNVGRALSPVGDIR